MGPSLSAHCCHARSNSAGIGHPWDGLCSAAVITGSSRIALVFIHLPPRRLHVAPQRVSSGADSTGTAVIATHAPHTTRLPAPSRQRTVEVAKRLLAHPRVFRRLRDCAVEAATCLPTPTRLPVSSRFSSNQDHRASAASARCHRVDRRRDLDPLATAPLRRSIELSFSLRCSSSRGPDDFRLPTDLHATGSPTPSALCHGVCRHGTLTASGPPRARHAMRGSAVALATTRDGSPPSRPRTGAPRGALLVLLHVTRRTLKLRCSTASRTSLASTTTRCRGLVRPVTRLHTRARNDRLCFSRVDASTLGNSRRSHGAGS